MERFKNFTDEQRLETIAATQEAESVIQKSTTVNGDIVTSLPICVKGTVNGNITSEQGITITGQVTGNCKASDVFTDHAKVSGNVESYGSVKVGIGTVIIGDVKANSAVIAGMIKGNVTITESVVIDASAAIVGDVSAANVQVNAGADIEGKCTIGKKNETKFADAFTEDANDDVK